MKNNLSYVLFVFISNWERTLCILHHTIFRALFIQIWSYTNDLQYLPSFFLVINITVFVALCDIISLRRISLLVLVLADISQSQALYCSCEALLRYSGVSEMLISVLVWQCNLPQYTVTDLLLLLLMVCNLTLIIFCICALVCPASKTPISDFTQWL